MKQTFKEFLTEGGRTFRNGNQLQPLKDVAADVTSPKFKVGQEVKVKKTGERVTIMSKREGLLFVASKNAVKVPDDKRLKIVPGKGYKEYMPRELEEV